MTGRIRVCGVLFASEGRLFPRQSAKGPRHGKTSIPAMSHKWLLILDDGHKGDSHRNARLSVCQGRIDPHSSSLPTTD